MTALTDLRESLILYERPRGTLLRRCRRYPLRKAAELEVVR